MQINNDSIQGMAPGVNPNDAVSMGQNAIMMDGVRYTRALPSTFNKTTASGSCTCYLTDDGTATGNPLYSAITSVQIIVNSNTIQPITSYSISGVTLTANVSQPSFNGVTILGINALGSLTVAPVPNGTSIKIIVQGVGNVL